jgi:hypothetical protein
MFTKNLGEKIMKKPLFAILAITLLLATIAIAQSKDESRPTTVSGNTIRAILVDDNPDSYQTYYYSMNLTAGRYTAKLKVKTKQCEGSGVSVYVDEFANVFTSSCEIETGIATATFDFTLDRSGEHSIWIYATGADGERLDVELSFSGGGGGKPTPTGKGQVCTFSDNFSVSDARPSYERSFSGLIFRKGSAQMFITTVNNEGTNVSGTVYAVQTDKGQYNENLVLPSDGFGGTIGTPLTNEPVREVQQISGNGKGYIKILFEQNGNGTNKTGRYTLVVQGDAIVSCGGGTGERLLAPAKKILQRKKRT